MRKLEGEEGRVMIWIRIGFSQENQQSEKGVDLGADQNWERANAGSTNAGSTKLNTFDDFVLSCTVP